MLHLYIPRCYMFSEDVVWAEQLHNHLCSWPGQAVWTNSTAVNLALSAVAVTQIFTVLPGNTVVWKLSNNEKLYLFFFANQQSVTDLFLKCLFMFNFSMCHHGPHAGWVHFVIVCLAAGAYTAQIFMSDIIHIFCECYSQGNWICESSRWQHWLSHSSGQRRMCWRRIVVVMRCDQIFHTIQTLYRGIQW